MPHDAARTPHPLVPVTVAQLAGSAGLGQVHKVYLPRRRNWLLLGTNVVLALVSTAIRRRTGSRRPARSRSRSPGSSAARDTQDMRTVVDDLVRLAAAELPVPSR